MIADPAACRRHGARATVASMSPRFLIPALAFAAGLAAAACDDNGRKDQNFGTDLGAGWVPPEPGPPRPEPAIEAAAPDQAPADAGADGDPVDAGVSVDATVD